MKHLFALLLLLTTSSSGLFADCCPCIEYFFYAKAGSGVCCPETMRVVALPPTWNVSLQGYNAPLGTRAIADASLGCELMRCLDLDVGIASRSIFKYRKFQTHANGGESYRREFDLNVRSILFSATLLGRDVPCFARDIACGTLYPMVGAGVGVSDLLITNFRTTGLPPSGESDPYASFSVENAYTLRRRCTYTVLAGVEYNVQDRFALSTGYRYFDAGRFKGPRFFRVANGSAVDVSGDEWKLRFRANEWFIALKMFF